MINPVLNVVLEVASRLKVPTPYLVGGFPRDQVLKKLGTVADFDITNGDNSIHMLAGATAEYLKRSDPATIFEYMPDNHAKVKYKGIELDFSSNYISPQAYDYIKTEDGMSLELLSRDFSCNTLLMKLDGSSIEDRLGTAIEDIGKKIIKTNMRPSITLVNDPKRIIRAIYLACKIGFEIDPAIVEFVNKNRELSKSVSKGFLNKKISQAMMFDKAKAQRYMLAMGISEVL